MRCPKCNIENKDSAKFCSKCGTPLNKTANNVTTVNNEHPQNNFAKYIIIALIVIIIALAGAFAYVELSGHDAEPQNTTSKPIADNDNQNAHQASQPSVSQMTIYSGSFSTGSSLSAKTYASLYVGAEHAGENVIVQIKYSRDGSSLNSGNMVPVTVDSSGYLDVSSADAYSYYPDYAVVNLYNTNYDLLDTVSVSLSPESGTQTF